MLIIAPRYAQLIAKYDKHVAEIVVSLKANNDLKTISICAAEPAFCRRISNDFYSQNAAQSQNNALPFRDGNHFIF